MKLPFAPTPRIPITPPVYFAPRARGTLVLDGRLNKPFWEHVPWTEEFVDISGPGFPTPRFPTRAKVCWDEENLYIAALLPGDEIWATIEKRDSVIYYDNDFEVFLDPSSCGHNYMELELNAFNTQWDLLLTHPYRDGGRSVTGWDIKGLETAVHVEGRINAPGAENKFWSVEIRIPFAGLMETYCKEENPADLERCYPARTAPRLGEFWRLNFSRVQWTVDVEKGQYRKRLGQDGRPLPEDNWVWAPTGLIDIHCPEFWGFLFFTDHGEAMAVPEDERRKLKLREFYYAQHAYHKAHGHYCADAAALGVPLPDYPVTAEATRFGFSLYCPSAQGPGCVVLRSDGFTGVMEDP